MKLFKFKKGVRTINIPFLLDVHSPWQDQIERELLKVKKQYKFGKGVTFGFEINSSSTAVIQVYKR